MLTLQFMTMLRAYDARPIRSHMRSSVETGHTLLGICYFEIYPC